jgi:tRNA uridine 5-carbamoylmethylation protein Kti12
MDLVFIYGPPASGKLTVSRELARITGYRVFHNHASLDFVGTIFDYGTRKFSELVVKYRMGMLEEAAKAGISVIFTSAYAEGPKTEATYGMMEMVRSHGGRVCPVYLHCSRDELLRRAGGESRKAYGKFTDSKQLKEFLKKYRMPRKPLIEGSLGIDNTDLTPREAAEAIARHYGLRRIGKRQRDVF